MEELVESILTPYDVSLMYKIPIRLQKGPDQLIWHWSSNGLYMVKSGQELAFDLYSNSDSFEVDGPWLRIWSGQFPLKIKDFTWRCLKNFIPTCARLANKGVNILTCVWCGEEETFGWSGINFSLLESNDINRFHRILTIMWSIWFHHNLLVWKGEAHSPQHVIDIADNFLMQWLEAQSVYGMVDQVKTTWDLQFIEVFAIKGELWWLAA
ncbi:hypothetical protein V6Z11_D13G183600 [Gossypium hirsutum]